MEPRLLLLTPSVRWLTMNMKVLLSRRQPQSIEVLQRQRGLEARELSARDVSAEHYKLVNRICAFAQRSRLWYWLFYRWIATLRRSLNMSS